MTIALVVDDDPVMRLLIRRALEKDGFVVHEAENGRAGVDRFALLQPDILLLDVLMPELDGFSACREIRATVQGARTPIVMLTGLDDVESIDRALEAGATDFIVKPMEWSNLAHRVRRLLHASQAG
jgi:DNA-binding response OmpR family regulator